MESPGGQREIIPSRAPSRSSTSSAHSHRYHHSKCNSLSSNAPPVSNLLQERLQKRQAERDGRLRISTSTLRREGGGSVHSSPTQRSATIAGRRSPSNSQDEEVIPMGAKETEKAVSALKNRVLDLQVEVYLRRERQSTLEERIIQLEKQNAKLEKNNAEWMEVQDSLMSELEHRDKAIGEAVEVILNLEASLEKLLYERETGNIIEMEMEMDGLSPHHSSISTPKARRSRSSVEEQNGAPHATQEPRANDVHLPVRLIGGKTLDRMPSFMSDHSEHTSNLRHVFSRSRSNLLHVRNISESSTAASEFNRIASPDLSVLSESSFTSVYGTPKHRSTAQHPDTQQSPQSGIKGSLVPAKKLSNEGCGRRRSNIGSGQYPEGPSNHSPRLNKSQVQPVHVVLDLPSPLQKLERLERRLSVESSSRPSTSSQGRSVYNSSSGGGLRSAGQVRTKQEKREALQKVVTNSPSARELANSHTLPPTPDTISSSTLRRHQTSNDTLASEQRVAKQNILPNDNLTKSAAALALRTSSRGERDHSSFSAAVPSLNQYTSMLARHPDNGLFANFSQLAYDIPQRPRSADLTSVSRHLTEDWLSESSSIHEEGNFDCWMRESARPHMQRDQNRSSSPDLFSFPEESGGWETDALFGAMHRNGFLGSPVSALKRDPMDELPPRSVEVQSSLQALGQGWGPGSVPPGRQSSLNARTGHGNANAEPPEHAKLRKRPLGERTGRGRSNSIDSATMARPTRAQLSQQTAGTSPPNKRGQPPVSGLQSKSRGLGGLHGLFRRSESINQNTGTTGQPVPEQIAQGSLGYDAGAATHGSSYHQAPPAPMPWRHTRGLDDIYSSATPPPIMRNRNGAHDLGVDGTEAEYIGVPQYEVEPRTPVTAVDPGPNNTPQSAGKKNWLSRMSSLKKRTG
ncbi:hypothetical protein BX600DRAFT_150875 [Xylariales sp. PMI_506]|nr:hypothetical protein BX600DRAFT_150875 [Xylariales sp. PMI_506]